VESSAAADAAADELYAVPPEEFVANRTRLAAELDGDDARRLKALRRPTVSAWTVNLLSREDALAPLLELGERLRDAWSHGDGIAALERERAELVGRLVQRSRALAEEQGRSLGEGAVREIEDTLQATVADPDSAEAVREGRLSKPLSHAGFGSMPMPPPSATRPAKPSTGQPKPAAQTIKQTAHQAEQATRRTERERLEKAVKRAEEALSALESDLGAATRNLAEADEELDRARTRLAGLEKDRADLYRRKHRITRERDQAARVAERARKRLPS
jgi:hypothetical protein